MTRCLIPLTSVLPFLEPRYVAEALDLLAPLAAELLPFGLLQELTSESKLAATIGSTNTGLQLRAIKVTNDSMNHVVPKSVVGLPRIHHPVGAEYSASESLTSLYCRRCWRRSSSPTRPSAPGRSSRGSYASSYYIRMLGAGRHLQGWSTSGESRSG